MDTNMETNLNKIRRNFASTDKFFKDNYKLLHDLALGFYKADENKDIKKNFNGPLNYLDDEEILLLVADFFQTINPSYEEKFWDAYENKKINYNKDIKDSYFYFDTYRNNYSVNVHKSNTISDAFSLVHEITHMLTMVKDGVLISTKKGEIYQEFPSILIEFLFCDYLKELGLSEYELELAKGKRKNEFAYNLKDIITKTTLYEIVDKKDRLTKEDVENLKGQIGFETEEEIEKTIEESAKTPVFYKYFIATALACSVYNRGVSKQEASEIIDGLNDILCRNYLNREGMDLNDLDYIIASTQKRFCEQPKPKVKSL